MSTSISSLYTITFLYVDPAICLWTVYLTYFAPSFMLNAYIPPNYRDKLGFYNPAQSFLFHQIGTAYLFMGWISAVLLRFADPRFGAKTAIERDLKLRVWRVVEAGLLMTDVSLIGSQIFALKTQGRLTFDKLRAEDVANAIILIWFGIVRSAFLTGAGVRVLGEGLKTQ